ncbi:hypothetical protein SERLA73DRAFT_156901 [Serpula lacrymans var. lacrymans S7.3]|uniref:Transmembrane protein n=1 Tax=Serpula lacrymans var. lacrymans (strain S7.3) TaxID=936435 RepID=F8QGH2_SERL3|nr:hypothetical protein SERLA73DRAFT_156901 [Serpula lacrymans var. lacrymans S7.3]
MRFSRNPFTTVALVVVCVCSGYGIQIPAVQAESINITVDDNGPFVYKPQALWHSSTTSSRSIQRAAELAYHGTWHYIMNAPSLPLAEYHEDINSADVPVTVEFNFTGSAVYLYSSLPLGNTSPSSLVNLTYSLDDVYAGRYIHDGSRFAAGVTHNVAIVSRSGLENRFHSLRVDVGRGSVFFFDYAVYTEERPIAGVLVTSDHSQNIMPRSNNVDFLSHSPMSSGNSSKGATFAVAIGATAGVLFVLSVGLAFNLYRRRRLSKRRGLEEQEEEELGEQSLYHGQSDRMHGPVPFIPRYFPGTLPPPPPYDPLSTQLDSLPTPSTPSYTPRQADNDGSYADHPPPPPRNRNCTEKGAMKRGPLRRLRHSVRLWRLRRHLGLQNLFRMMTHWWMKGRVMKPTPL